MAPRPPVPPVRRKEDPRVSAVEAISAAPFDDPIPNHKAGEDGKKDEGKKEDPKKPSSKFSLGQNRKPRSGVRQLTAGDIAKLEEMYTYIALPCMALKQSLGMAIAQNANKCAEAWGTLAAENDNVRRILLVILEGSAWGILIGAHVPILLAAIPERAFENNPAVSTLMNLVNSEDDKGEE